MSEGSIQETKRLGRAFQHTRLRRCQLGKKADFATHLSRVC